MLGIISLIAAFCSNESLAQDAEFSQFYHSPIHSNPAMIGFSLAPRFAFHARTQDHFIKNAYVTLAASVDAHLYDINSSVGLSILQDRQAELLNVTQLNAHYAYTLRVSETISIKAGAQIGVIQHSLNDKNLVSGLNIDPTAGGANGGSLAGISLDKANTTSFDVGSGLFVYSNRYYLGIAAEHLTRPKVHFTPDQDVGNNIPLKLSLQMGTTLYFGKGFELEYLPYLSPSVYYVFQQPFHQLMVGAMAGDPKYFGGAWLRHNIKNFDALVLMVGFNRDALKIAYSYDINLSGIPSRKGAHEISVVVDLSKRRDYQEQRFDYHCPKAFKN